MTNPTAAAIIGIALVRTLSMCAEFASRGIALEAVRALEVLENSSDAIVMLDYDWRYIYLNGRAEVMARVPRGHLLGQNFWELFPEDDVPAVREPLQRTLQERSPVRFEYFYAPYDLWVEVNVYPTAEGIAMLIRDIGDRKSAERRMRESEERYRRLFEATQDGILIVNDEGCYVEVNDSYCRILKASRERLIGANFAEFIPSERIAEAESYFQLLRQGSAKPLDFPLRALDGSIVDLAWTASSDYLPGLHFYCCREIGAQKKAEHERAVLLSREQEVRVTAQLVNSVGPMLLAELDPKKVVKSVIEIATRLTGAEVGCFFHNTVSETGEEHIRVTLAGARAAEFTDAARDQVFESTLLVKGALRSGDIAADPRLCGPIPYFTTTQGNVTVRSCLTIPLASRSVDVHGALFFGHSQPNRFSEMHESIATGIAAQAAIAFDNARLFEHAQWVQAELSRSNEDLRRANKDLETFAYSASHDLQEPLRNVSLSAQLLRRVLNTAEISEEGRKFMDGILKGAQRMENLVRDLLTYTRATQHSDAPMAEVDANSTLASVLLNLKSRIEQSGAQITSSDLPVVSMQEVHLAQLFQNLVSNAIKYRGNESPRIQISAGQQHGWWVFSVADNGIGIDPRYGTQIFGLFKRLHTRDEYPGSGIGLAICQRIVEQHGGRIWLERSAPGQGSVFCFSLPAK